MAVAALCLQATPASASSTLLSGYGGPGQGNQAIIGATLIGGGGGSGGSSGSESAAAANGSAPASIVLPRTPARTTARSRSHKRPAGRRAKPTSSGEGAGSNGSTRLATARATGGALGLTGSDLLYAILASCVLVGTAILTVRLSGRGGPAAGARQRQRSG